MLISQPVTSCLTSHRELCMPRLLNNQSRRISIYRLQCRPSFGFESSVSSTLLTSDDPVARTRRHTESQTDVHTPTECSTRPLKSESVYIECSDAMCWQHFLKSPLDSTPSAYISQSPAVYRQVRKLLLPSVHI